MLNFLQAAILGIVEGITEFLPISSTGHLILTSKLMNIPESEFTKSFEVIIQFGAILAAVWLYWKTILLNKEVFKKVIIGFVPTGILGLLFYKNIKQLLGSQTIVLWSLLIGGVLIILFEYFYKAPQKEQEQVRDISYKHAILLGFFQTLAFIPGVSRAAATIIGGLLLGYKRKTVVEFSFLLAIPTMLSASGLEMVTNYNEIFGSGLPILAVGFVISFFIALFAIKWLLRFIQTRTFTGFGIYRIIVSIVGFFII